MKLLFPAAVVVAISLTGCASMGDPKLLTPLTKVALVSVSANGQVYEVGAEPPKPDLLSMAANTVSNNQKVDGVVNRFTEGTQAILDKAEGQLLDALTGAKGSPLMAKDALFASKAYAGLADSGISAALGLKPAGYKFFQGSDAVYSLLAKDLRVQGTLVASFLFQKNMTFGMMGTGSLGAQTSMLISAYDATGKMVFSKNYVAKSTNTIAVLAGVYDFPQFETLAAEATQAAVGLFAADLAAR